MSIGFYLNYQILAGELLDLLLFDLPLPIVFKASLMLKLSFFDLQTGFLNFSIEDAGA